MRTTRPTTGPYLNRPWPLNPENHWSHFIVSEPTVFGEKLLREYDRYHSEAKASAGGSYLHMFMTRVHHGVCCYCRQALRHPLHLPSGDTR